MSVQPYDDAPSFTPTVLSPLTGPALLSYVLSTQVPSKPTALLVCSTRAEFLQSLLHSLQNPQNGSDAEQLEEFLIPRIHQLFTAQYIKLTFYASLQGLVAYLSAYQGQDGSVERLILINPIALHASTSAYSAQGLSRTFAAAVETAARVRAEIYIIECLDMRHARAFGAVDEEAEGDIIMKEVEDDGHAQDIMTETDPWEQEVSILSVSARTFGSGTSERSWAGRKVKIRSVATRWCRFEQPRHHHQEVNNGNR